MNNSKYLLPLFVFLTSISYAYSQEHNYGGHIKVLEGGLDFLNSSKYADLTATEIRVFEKISSDNLTFEIHPQILTLSSSKLSEIPSPTLPDDSFQFFNLTGEVIDDKDTQGVVRIDKLTQRFALSNSEFEFGRIPISLGNGLVFHPLDIGSFAPTALDKEYKSGSDAIRFRQVFEFADLEAFYVPRKEVDTRSYEDSLSSELLRIKKESIFHKTDLQITSGRHLDSTVFGGGINRELFDGMTRGDLIWFKENHEDHFGGVINYDRTFYIFERNIYGFIEYFHSPYGSNRDGYLIPKDGRDLRLLTGESYTLGKNYLSIGGDIETSPLTKLGTSAFINLQDGSFLLQPAFRYNLLQDAELLLGAIIRFGQNESEFGGSDSNLQNYTHQAYARFAYYY